MSSESQFDLEVLQGYVDTLTGYKGTWEGTTLERIDQGENQGDTIDKIYEIDDALDQIQQSYITLLDTTITYFTNRIATLTENESNATDAVNETATSGGTNGTNGNSEGTDNGSNKSSGDGDN
ncbi:MAG: DUF5344 family protein [Pseudobutyrivibrio sp.]|nr:DUF5344 family protein [Pseudobutyrivibrio sp.]